MQDSDDASKVAADFPVFTVVRDHTEPEGGLRYLVMRGPLCFCAYVGVPEGHVLAGAQDPPLARSHNFQSWGSEGSPWPAGWYWWGWDYGHAGSVVDFEGLMGADFPTEFRQKVLEMSERLQRHSGFAHKNWTVAEVEQEAQHVLAALREVLQHAAQGIARASGRQDV